jgi:hypothetical protein
MKSFARPSFFRTFELLLSRGNPGLKRSTWTHCAVEWERHKQSFSGPKLGATIDICMLTKGGKRGWSMIVIKEYWWTQDKTLKTSQWAKPLDGSPRVILDWFRDQEESLERDGLAVLTGGDRALEHTTGEDVEASTHDLS